MSRTLERVLDGFQQREQRGERRPQSGDPESVWRWWVDSARDNAGRLERLAQCPEAISEKVRELVRGDIARRKRSGGR